ncbi:Na+/H+ antiporter subunit E [Corynebacterium choanae]|uniref:Putative monovalent cation/H+ antiporter subunit E n=1 Tax=Corynebacterium choanae TaxID=1862358 RepID=A0A3G6J488_9CORY|nr:Na+/H+ antiporter subunit E [Corynebacterium choanae]AZA12722.1 putative monovalent cation/H+ antiporter subunit E [Corynebacterium choanae]
MTDQLGNVSTSRTGHKPATDNTAVPSSRLPIRAKLSARIRPFPVVVLTLLWVLLVGQITLGNVLAGILLAVAVMALLPLPPLPSTIGRIRIVALLALLGEVAISLVTSSFAVAKLAIGTQPPPKTAIITCDYPVSDDIVAAFGILLMNLQPGGTVIFFDQTHHTVTMHLLNAGSDAAIRTQQQVTVRFAHKLCRIFQIPPVTPATPHTA